MDTEIGDIMQWDTFTNQYIEEIKQNDDFIQYLKLKDIINISYKKEIIRLKNAEALYLDSKEHPINYPDLKKVQLSFVEAKKCLYEKEEVHQFFTLEKKIQRRIDQDLDELKNTVSNKFSTSTNFF